MLKDKNVSYLARGQFFSDIGLAALSEGIALYWAAASYHHSSIGRFIDQLISTANVSLETLIKPANAAEAMNLDNFSLIGASLAAGMLVKIIYDMSAAYSKNSQEFMRLYHPDSLSQ